MTYRSALHMAMVAVALASPPHTQDKVATARWMTSNIEWGVLSTTSTRNESTAVGEPFGNPYSFADANSGVPYFYASDLDATMIDLFTAAKPNPRATLAISEGSLHNRSTSATQAACKIGSGTYGDPENPPCARLVLSGKMVKLEKGSAEDKIARASLFKRHPSFKLFPPGHSFYAVKMVVDGVWLIDFYGGAAIIPPAQYFAGNSSVGSMRGVHTEIPSATPIAKPPNPFGKAGYARWMAKTLEWGVLSTTSSRSEGIELGDAFGNPYSFADASTGVPYFYASNLDASMIDIFTAANANPKASLALSEASLGGTPDEVPSCEIGAPWHPFADPENPPCARLVLSGTMVTLPANTSEYTKARASLFARHPSFAKYPPGHDFFVAKMEVEGVWLIDAYGGAAIIKPADYFAAKVPDEIASNLVAPDSQCCLTCTAPQVKYYSVDTVHGHCGECCMQPKNYNLFKVFEPNLLLADGKTCSDFGYQNYDSTVTHGVWPVKMTLDLYDKPDSDDSQCCITCTAPLVKYYSIDTEHGHCGECCMQPKYYNVFKVFEPNLLLADGKRCSDFGYQNYDTTVSHGVWPVKMTLDLYDQPASEIVV